MWEVLKSRLVASPAPCCAVEGRRVHMCGVGACGVKKKSKWQSPRSSRCLVEGGGGRQASCVQVAASVCYKDKCGDTAPGNQQAAQEHNHQPGATHPRHSRKCVHVCGWVSGSVGRAIITCHSAAVVETTVNASELWMRH